MNDPQPSTRGRPPVYQPGEPRPKKHSLYATDEVKHLADSMKGLGTEGLQAVRRTIEYHRNIQDKGNQP